LSHRLFNDAVSSAKSVKIRWEDGNDWCTGFRFSRRQPMLFQSTILEFPGETKENHENL